MSSKFLALSILIIFLAFTSDLFAASYIEIQNFNSNRICRYKDANGNWAYTQPNLHDIGRDNGSNGINSSSDSDIYRSAYSFDLSALDDDITITSVTLYMQCGYFQNPETMKIGKYPGDPINHTNDEIWNNVNAISVYYSSVTYGYLGNLPSNNDLKSDVQNALSGNTFSIGILSNDENTNLSYQDWIQFTLKIDYLQKYNITVINSFGGGDYSIDGTIYSHNQTHRLSEDSTYAFENWDQNYEGTDYVFLDEWTNISSGQVYLGNPASLSFTSNATLRAEFDALIHLQVKNRGDGGQIKVDSNTYDSGVEFDFVQYSPHDFESWEQSFGGYMRKFKDLKWTSPDGPFYSAIVDDHSVEWKGIWESQLMKEFNISVDNLMLDGGSGGEVFVNDSSVSSPHLAYVLEEDNITVKAVPFQTIEINGKNIEHKFLNYSDRDVINWGNQMPFPELERSYSPVDHQKIDLLFKAHLHTNKPEQSDTKNQRRLLTLGDTWIMVYESNGDIWLTASADAGLTWCEEERLNIR